ncbi:YkvA family protein [Heliophilum fasciatum]|uniref:Uncharacterized protein DUF1232 n=1 Tax=Heliophilum fasciatum TaxID=35700 RepID=A0A4R2RWQ7_9FIRM|nr:YkvA family protein [Heliophilum fasciatum]MCW2276719.1 uncharacterized membrane protein YkvA (DUF1232 family) [Heliophilum fasciatum]TCP68900.1 uncharacterized protein DUF1232 [Heliophilum fasciatum]
MDKSDNEIYREAYSDKGFWQKLAQYGKQAGTKVVYAALLLYYVLQEPDVPKWAKMTVLGALGYLILPVDLFPDLLPVVGYTDDFASLIAALITVAMYINGSIREKARGKMRDWFGDAAENDMIEVEAKILK